MLLVKSYILTLSKIFSDNLIDKFFQLLSITILCNLDAAFLKIHMCFKKRFFDH